MSSYTKKAQTYGSLIPQIPSQLLALAEANEIREGDENDVAFQRHKREMCEAFRMLGRRREDAIEEVGTAEFSVGMRGGCVVVRAM